jgi:anti-sigma regulatory factor (Ser/Thr protein kinase)
MPARLYGETKEMTAATRTPTLALTVPAEPQSVRRVRRALAEGGLHPDLDHTVTLLASELVSNSIRHAGHRGDITVEAVLQGDFVRVDVVDPGPGFDPEVRHGARGFGLRLIDKLASRWGVEGSGPTRVWFEVDRRRRRFERV